MPIFGVILVHVFPHLDWILRISLYSVRIQSEYSVSLRIQSKCGEMRTSITRNTNTFYAVIVMSQSWEKGVTDGWTHRAELTGPFGRAKCPIWQKPTLLICGLLRSLNYFHRNLFHHNRDPSHILTSPLTVRLNTFRHRTLLYRAKKDIKQKKGYKIRLDLTKSRYLMLSEANKLASDNQNANFCYADVNCRLKIRWNDNQEDFFTTLEDLRDLLDRNC